ncbi:helix-turn-helix domain-containing protein [Spongisporangium articulatum]|uniref:Helix-turn-helix domain-containing protein n=1 Tax=Spongisporangium articulatum TaxID=3362603 RepID=A0ABW8AIQ1_9ACTN
MRRKDAVRRDSQGREIEGPPDTRAARLLAAARRRTLQYQSEVAEKAGIAPSAISAYETGTRQPTLPMLSKLLEATGHELVLDIRPLPSEFRLVTSEFGDAIRRQREAIVTLAGRYGLRDLHVNRNGRELFVDVSVATMMERRLFAAELEALLGFPVRVTPVAPEQRDELRGWTVRLGQDQGRAERSDQ